MRLIDADKLAEDLGITNIHSCHKCTLRDPNTYSSYCTKSEDFVEACEAIEKAPEIITELPANPIRCKNCKHFAGEAMYCAQNIIVPFDHFYCYYGET